MAKGRKLRVTLQELSSDKPGGKRWEVTLSSGDGVIAASGALGQLTAVGRLNIIQDVLARFILWGEMPDDKRKRARPGDEIPVEVVPP